jgi:hypothetical protein
MYADKENCNTYGVLRFGRESQGIPPSDRIIHIRQFVPDWRIAALNMTGGDADKWTVNEAGVRAWADHVVDRLSHWQGTEEHHQKSADIFMDPLVAISPYNEMDIEPVWVNYMQTRHWYDLIGRIALVWLDQINRRRPDRKCLTMTPPLAGGHEPWGDPPDSEYTLPAMRDMLQAFDVIGGHCYGLLNQAPTRGMFGSDAKWYGLRLWRGMTELSYPDTDLSLKNDEDPGGLCYQARALGKKVHNSEAGTFRLDDNGYVDENWRHMSRQLDVASRSGLVTGHDWFIWNSNSAHSGNRIWYSEGLRAKLENAPRYQAAEWPAAGQQPIPPDPLPPPVVEPPPVPTDPYVIGDGFRDAMQQLGTKPIMNEQPPTVAFPLSWIYDDAGNFFVYGPTMGVRAHLSQVLTATEPAPSPPPPPLPPPSPPPSAVELADWPYTWSQLTDWTSDADKTDENKFNNCGPECLSMVIKWVTGYEDSADTIKDRIKGDAHVGFTFVNPDLSQYLQTQASIPVRVYHEGEAHNIRQVIQDALNQEHPVCVLYTYLINGRGVNHFAVAVGYDANNVILANPWQGTKDVVTWADFERAYLRWSIVCQRPRDLFLRAASRSVEGMSLDRVPIGGAAGLVTGSGDAVSSVNIDAPEPSADSDND